MATNIVVYILGFIALTNALHTSQLATRVSHEVASATKYDFIIVGGGVSGLTVADRLTEHPAVKVLVIEAGPLDDGREGVTIPGAYDPAAYIWQPLTSQPQTALNNRTFLATCARVVGGGSVVNAMVYLRGAKPEYAAWEELGAKGWAWDDLLPYFKKSESFTLPSEQFAAEANISWVESAHGTEGPVQASYPNYYFPGSVKNNAMPNTDMLDTNATYDAEQRDLYNTAREGAYTIVRGLGTMLANPPLRNTTSNWKDIVSSARVAHVSTSLPSNLHPTVRAGYIAQREHILSQLEGPDVPVGLIHWTTGRVATITLLKPLSRGSVNIKSTDPRAPPLVDFGTATDPLDLDLFLATFGKNREIMSTPYMQSLGPHEAAPFGDNITSIEQLKVIFAATMGVTGGHECCTAAMMPRNMGGVVDPRMKVYGVEGLRVVDTSFWPMLLTAPPLATTYAVGEKVGIRYW
ncbi:putative glucose-methanol-choline oxidoreductase [Aspergillus flavus]|uniref:Glucose-methanol-choline oxidoreductase n=1 Tax=Aspergillus flavus (strain ATCC 200026 / FGSC A1120 / IAM 13836 / NRRL 3357 / JCM 12722 / SRRC 167) TaxID=332952 RepID=A0A7U2MWT9_ASPFN|nr:putative glucose-methanol-choline oxidoreductase [Aspergillus flavus]